MPATTVVVSLGFAALSLLALYAGVFQKLWHDWANDDNYSHGFLIIPLAAYFAWERREALRSAAKRPSFIGLVVTVTSLAVLVMGVLGAELFLTRISIIGVLAGAVLFVLGRTHFLILLFPLAFLVLMVPLPAIIFNQIAFPLQLLASQVGAGGLQALHIPVLREGNIIVLASTTLEVAEACSGIRSLISLLTLGIVFGYYLDSRVWVRVVVALATIPIAVASNGFRVAGTGIAANYYGPQAAEGFMHTFSGWLVFVVAFVMLFIVYRLLIWLAPERPRLSRSPLKENLHVAAKA